MREAEQHCPVCKAHLGPTARFCGGCGYAVAPTATNYDQDNDDAAPSMVGQEVAGRYRILGKLGEGGMGAVYRAEQISLKREIALKVLKPELSERPGLVRRFNAEAELAAKLNHPNTVTLYDFGQDKDGSLFIAMELIAGRSLRDLLVREGPQPSERVAAIGAQVCASLADAHATGIVHRDLKPDNVMLSERGKKRDVVTVLDFGIAKLRDEDGNITQQPMTRAGDMLGTPQYMAPEQIRGDRVDARTDIYAIGVMLYEMATARLPFDAKSIMALLSMHLTEPPIPMHQRRRDLRFDPGLEHLIMRCLAKNPNERPASMDAVEDILTALGPVAGPISGNAAPPMAGHFAQEGPNRSMSPMPGAMGAGQAYSAPSGAGAATPHTPMASQPITSSPQHPATPVSATTNQSVSSSASPTPVRQQGPRTHGQAQSKSKTWLWISMALILLGGGGFGLYLALAPADESQEEGDTNSADDFMSDWAGDSPPSDNHDMPDGFEDVDEDMAELQDELDELQNENADRPHDYLYAGSRVYTDAKHGYLVELPASFRHDASADESREGGALFSGRLNGHKSYILTAAWPQSSTLNDDATRANLEKMAKDHSYQILSVAWQGAGSERVIRGKIATTDASIQGDYIFLRKQGLGYFAAIGSAPKHYAKNKKYYESFLEWHFHPMAN